MTARIMATTNRIIPSINAAPNLGQKPTYSNSTADARAGSSPERLSGPYRVLPQTAQKLDPASFSAPQAAQRRVARGTSPATCVGPTIDRPHRAQNLAPAAFSSPHDAQRRSRRGSPAAGVSGTPHAAQKAASVAFSSPQLGQFIEFDTPSACVQVPGTEFTPAREPIATARQSLLL